MHKKIAVYCLENSLDGIASAAILFRMARLKGYDCKIGFLSYSDPEKIFDEMVNLASTMIFIVDFPFEHFESAEKKIKKIESSLNKIIYWSSHQKSKFELIERMQKSIQIVDFTNEKKCAAELAAKRFMPMDKVSNELALIAHDCDFWIRGDERSVKLADIIASGFSKKELIEELSKGIFWSELFEKTRDEYLVKKEEALQDIAKNLIIKEYGNTKLGYALASNVLSTADAGEKVLENEQVSIAVVIYRDGKIIFRRKNDVTIDLKAIAEIFNGGGHPYAAGGKLENLRFIPIRSKQDFEYACNHVDKEIMDKGFIN